MDRDKKILEKCFLKEVNIEEGINGWKVIGKVEGCSGSSLSEVFELKTEEESWPYDFRVKLLHCGLILVSPEYIFDEDDFLVEVIEEYWKSGSLEKDIEEAIRLGLFNPTTTTTSGNNWIYTSSPNITCTNATASTYYTDTTSAYSANSLLTNYADPCNSISAYVKC